MRRNEINRHTPHNYYYYSASKNASQLPSSKLTTKFKIILIVLLIISCITVPANGAEQFLAASVSVGSWVVSSTTTFSFQLFLNTFKVATRDYLIIILPSGVSFRTTGTSPTCTAPSLTIASCTIISSSRANITFTTSSTTMTSIEGSISNFINPDSVRIIQNIEIDLYASTGVLKAVTTQASLSNFQASSMTVALSSSSNVVGNSAATLTVSVTPSTLLKATGILVLTVPPYYANAGSNYIFSTTSPTCGGTGLTVTGCVFSQSSLQVTILYTLTTGADTTALTRFTIGNFKNPISTQPQTGYTLVSQDSAGNNIGLASSITLSGITVPAAFATNVIYLIDSTQIGEYTSLQIKLSMNVALQQNCYVKFVFPPELVINQYMSSITGQGFFMQSASSSVVPWITKDTTNNIITVQACQLLYGANQAGTITFTTIQNPAYVTATGTFQIYVAQDSAFNVIISQVTTGFTLPASTFTPGSVSAISAKTSGSNYVQTETNYTVTFTPRHNMNAAGAQIVIVFPSLITFSTTNCLVSDISASLSSTVSCTISDRTVTLIKPFTAQYTGGTPISLTIYKGINPTSSRDAGTFTITTYIQISSVLYIVDSGSASGLITPTGGYIKKLTDITASSYQTYASEVTYTFNILFQHTIPQNGFIKVILPAEVGISSSSLVKSSCLRIDTNKKMTCAVSSSNQILITLDSLAFTGGYPSMTGFIFSIGGLLNPRSTQPTSVFEIYSTGVNGYNIDASLITEYFVVSMVSISNLIGVSVETSNQVSGASSTFTISVVPNTPVSQNDAFTIQFPSDIALPGSNSLSCGLGGVITNIQSLSCIKSGSNQVTVTLLKISTISPKSQFSFQVYNVQNPPSTAPSNSFSNMILMSSSGAYNIAQFQSSDVRVQTSQAGTITDLKLTQSNKNPNATAIYTITFSTNNPIPPLAAVIVTTPSVIKLTQTSSACTLATTQIRSNVCTIQNNLVIIQNAFTTGSESFQGIVTIKFQATNPQDNSNLQTISFMIYTDSTYRYKVDQANSNLIPQLYCNFPCLLCDQSNPNYCTDCFTNDNSFPQFIQYQAKTGSQTCAYKCSDGYTSNGSQNPKTCTACSQQCSTCKDEGNEGDINNCLSCSQGFPFYNTATKECWNFCKEGTYLCDRATCCNCVAPCATCSSPTQCKSCVAGSSQPFLQASQCVSQCSSGYTPVNSICVPCSSPCATCEVGLPTSCLSCNSATDKIYLFGRACVGQCPNGTVPDLVQRKCMGCVDGCDTCQQNDNSKCIRCSNGLALYDNDCVSVCPFNYAKSVDGSVCELRPYLLEDSVVYFPFLIATVALSIISITSFFTTQRKSLIITNTIALISLTEFASIVAQFIIAYKKQYYYIALGSGLVLGAQILVNSSFVVYYMCKLQFSDISYNYWRQKYSVFVTFILVLSVGCSNKLFRLLYGRLFRINFLSANIANHQKFLRKIHIFSAINLAFYTLPLIIVDILILLNITWGTQLYITTIESGIISIINVLLMVIEHCCKYNRFLHYEERAKFLEDKKLYEKLNFSKSQLDIEKRNDEKQHRKLRQNVLQTIIHTVKNNKDLYLNNNLDDLMEHESAFKKFLFRKTKSMTNLSTNYPQDMKGEDDRQIETYPNSPVNKESGASSFTLQFDTVFKKTPAFYTNKEQRTIEALQVEFKYDNVYAEGRATRIVKPWNAPKTVTTEIQTDVLTNDSLNQLALNRRQQAKTQGGGEASESFDSQDGQTSNKKRESRQRGKKKSQYYNQIQEEDEFDVDILSPDQAFPRANMGQDQLNASESRSKLYKAQLGVIFEDQNENKSKQGNSILQGEQQTLLDDAPSYRDNEVPQNKGYQYRIIDDEYYTQRTFNIFDILGNFDLDSEGKIINMEKILEKLNYHDRDGKLVNQSGYLMDPDGQGDGDIISKHSFNRMFKGSSMMQNGEIPLPYSMECFNFNPHEIMGNFDYDKKSEKPIILKNKQKRLVDKNLRLVNVSGLLIDEQDSIIDNQGRIKFVRQMLDEKGDIPKLLNYKGKSYNFREIIGTFARDNNSKEIVLNQDPIDKNLPVDKLGRKVNGKGYLVDRMGNIVNKERQIIFRKGALMFNEPPKIFSFINFNISDIKGKFNVDNNGEAVLEYSLKGQLIDLEGRCVNPLGYLIDQDQNIIDQRGNIVFNQEILDDYKDFVRVEIPKVFRSSKLRQHGLQTYDMSTNMILPTEQQQLEKDLQNLQIEKEQQWQAQQQLILEQQQQALMRKQQEEAEAAEAAAAAIALMNEYKSEEQYIQEDDGQQSEHCDVMVLSEQNIDQINQELEEKDNEVFAKRQMPKKKHAQVKQERKVSPQRSGKAMIQALTKPTFPVPMQNSSRAKSLQKVRQKFVGQGGQGQKEGTGQYDYNLAAHPNSYMAQDKSKARLANIANSMNSFNSTGQIKSVNQLAKNSGQQQFQPGMTDTFNLMNAKNNIMVKKNQYIQDFDQEQYVKYLDNEVDPMQVSVNQSALQDGGNKQRHAKSKNRLQQSQLDNFYPQSNSEIQFNNPKQMQNQPQYGQYYMYNNDSEISDNDDQAMNNENFNLDRSGINRSAMGGSRGNSRGRPPTSYLNDSRTELNSQYSGRDSQLSKKDFEKVIRRNKLENKMKGLARIYNQKSEGQGKTSNMGGRQGGVSSHLSQSRINMPQQPVMKVFGDNQWIEGGKVQGIGDDNIGIDLERKRGLNKSTNYLPRR